MKNKREQKCKKLLSSALCTALVFGGNFGIVRAENVDIIETTDSTDITVENPEILDDVPKIIADETDDTGQTETTEAEAYAKEYYLDQLPLPFIQEDEETEIPQVLAPENVPSPIQTESKLSRVACGYAHYIFLKDDMTVSTFGLYYDQAYDFNYGLPSFDQPVQVPNLEGVISVSAGEYYGIALKADGTVWTWSADLKPVLNDRVSISTPTQVEGLSDIVSISASGEYNLALRRDGTVWQWGKYNDIEQIDVPEQVIDGNGAALQNIQYISAGTENGLAVSGNGAVYAWGDNFYGQLGDGTRESRTFAAAVPKLETIQGIRSVKAMDGYNLIEDVNGQQWAWGKSDDILGKKYDTHLWYATPIETENIHLLTDTPLPPTIELDTYGPMGIALCQDGSVWKKGKYKATIMEQPEGLWAEVIPYETPWEKVPEWTAEVLGEIVENRTGLAASAFGNSHSMAVVNGVLMASGDNKWGQLGDGTFTSSEEPVTVLNYLNEELTDVKKISAGYGYNLILTEDGRVWSVGYNEYGKLGNGNSENQNKVVPVKGKNGNGYLRGFTDVAAGYKHSLAVKEDGSVWAWGSNSHGQLGTGNRTMSIYPVRTVGVDGEDWIKDAVSAAANADCSMVLHMDGTVSMWGNNDKGQLGNGNKENQTRPVKVRNENGTGVLANIKQIATAEGCSLALSKDGTVWSWGGNQNGRLGDGTTIDRYYPQKVQKSDAYGGGELSDIIFISAGYYFNAAVDSNGYVWVWGKNDWGQLGNNSRGESYKAEKVKGITGDGELGSIVSVSCGREYMMALRSDQKLLSWGRNRFGQFGIRSSGNGCITPIRAFKMADVEDDYSDVVDSPGLVKMNARMTGKINYADDIDVFVIDGKGPIRVHSSDNVSIKLCDYSGGELQKNPDGSYQFPGGLTPSAYVKVTGHEPGEYSFRLGTEEKNIKIWAYEGTPLNLLLQSDNTKIQNEQIFEVYYNPGHLGVSDLAGTTAGLDLVTGKIPGTDVTVLEFDPVDGYIKLQIDDSGYGVKQVSNIIQFIGLTTEETEIKVYLY